MYQWHIQKPQKLVNNTERVQDALLSACVVREEGHHNSVDSPKDF
jgi:hypothetical protein